MKTRFQKSTALILVLMMLVTMVPMGLFTANAAVSSELAAGLANIDGTAEFVINSVEDWNAVAATNNQFLNKTIKLGADIDAQGAALPMLFPFGNVRCTFDGQGHAIKNVGTAQAPIDHALLSNKSNLNVQNLTVQNVYVSGAGNKAILVEWQNCWAKYTFKNIKVIDCSVTSTDTAAAALIAYLTGNGSGYGVDFENILVSGTTIVAANKAGALAGDIYFNSGDYGSSAKNIEVVDTTLTDNAAESSVAGLFGYFRHHVGTSLTVENAYVKATFLCPNSAGWTGINTALFRSHNSSVANNNTITVKNCITDCTYAAGVVQSTTLFYAAQAIFVAENLFSTRDIGKAGMLANGSNTVNGSTNISSGYEAINDTIVPAANVAAMITRSESGFITGLVIPGGGEGSGSGTPTPPPTPDISETVVIIDSIEKWKEIAATNNQYVGKTFKLGADLDAGGATLPILFVAGNTGATFDGQGHTIKNVGSAEAPNPTSLLCAKFNGSIKDLNVENVIISGTGSQGVLVGWLNGWGTNTVENIKFTNCQVTSADGAAGIVAGQAAGNNANVVVTVKNINVDVTCAATGAGAVGGIYGNGGHSGTFNIENVIMSAILTGTGKNADENCVGGLFGYEAANASSVFNITNCIVNGALISKYSTHLGSLGGYYNGAETKVMNVNGFFCSNSFSTKARYSNMLTVVRGNGNFNYANVYLVADRSNHTWCIIAYNYNTMLNGVRNNGELHSREDIMSITEATAWKIIHIDESTGFISSVDSVLHTCETQVGTVTDGKYAVRFIAKTQMVEPVEITMTVKATTASGVVKTFVRSHELYDRVTAFEKHHISQDVTAKSMDAEQLGCITVYNIPTGENVTFEVTCSFETTSGLIVAGNTMTVTIDANGTIVK